MEHATRILTGAQVVNFVPQLFHFDHLKKKHDFSKLLTDENVIVLVEEGQERVGEFILQIRQTQGTFTASLNWMSIHARSDQEMIHTFQQAFYAMSRSLDGLQIPIRVISLAEIGEKFYQQFAGLLTSYGYVPDVEYTTIFVCTKMQYM
jgi:hypothetical protein